jgi:adenylate cyclase
VNLRGRSRAGAWALRAMLVLVPLALCALHAAGSLRLPLVQALEFAIDDTRARAFMGGASQQPIAIVDVDEASLRELGRWPWPRDRLARLVDELFGRQRAAVVGFDLLFAEADRADLSAIEELAATDRALAERLPKLQQALDRDHALAAALRGRQVALGYYLTSDRDGQRSGALPQAIFTTGDPSAQIRLTRWNGYAAALPAFAAAAPRGGFFNAVADDDGVVRSLPLLARLDDGIYESLVLAMLRAHTGEPAVHVVTAPGDARPLQVELRQDGQRLALPVDARGAARVPFRGAGGPKGGVFRYVSAADLLAGRLPAQSLAGALVLIGTTAPGLADLRPTPAASVYPGVEVHASLLAGALDGVVPWQPAWSLAYELALLGLTALLLGVALPRLAAAWAVALAAAVMLGHVALNVSLYAAWHWALPVAALLVFTALASAALVSWGWITEGRVRRSITRLFGSYVPPEIVAELARDPARYDMRAENRVMTVMFCDLRGFTTISERLEPQALREVINAFFSRMTNIIRDHRGTLDKYIGDCIMAFWGAPLDDPDHAAHGVRAALAMARAMDDLNAELAARGLPAIALGIGLNTGLMCVGDMGSHVRRAYTVMGDAVNLASRIEGLTRQYGVSVLAGEATRAAAGDAADLHWREVDRVRVKGREAPVTVFTPAA